MNIDDVITSRRAYKNLMPVDIDEKIIQQLIKAASLSPSCFNNQPWRFAFVKDKQKMAELHSVFSRGNAWAQKASMVIAVYTSEELDCIVKTRKYFLFDTGMATAFLMLKATELGLVAHPIAGFRPKPVKEILNIDPEMKVIALLIVGKHDNSIPESPRPERLPAEKFTQII